jgi:uncharacterized protein (DUF2461 family)
MTPTDEPGGGFPPEALQFFAGLRADNSKAYWVRHRGLYRRAVAEPLAALMAGLAPRYPTFRVLTPYQDLRYSADRSPYRNAAAALARDAAGAPGLYVQLSAEGLLVAGGYFRMTRDQMVRYRAAAGTERAGGLLGAVLRSLLNEGHVLSGDGRRSLTRRKELAAIRDFGTPGWLSGPRCADEVAAAWHRLAPLSAWLAEHVGPPERALDPTEARIWEGDPGPALGYRPAR